MTWGAQERAMETAGIAHLSLKFNIEKKKRNTK
jgi:hypothetical protein